MNFKTWLYSFVNKVPSIISSPARWIADRMYGIVADGVKFARWIGKGVSVMVAKGIVFVAMTLSFAIETATTLQWLYSVEIPRRILAGLNAAKAWASPIINGVKSTLQGAINALHDWITRRVNELVNAANSLRNWALSQLNSIRDYLNNTVGKWVDRLSSPSKFAEWIVGSIITAMLGYLYANRDKIARFVLNSSPAATTWLARQLESIIGRLL